MLHSTTIRDKIKLLKVIVIAVIGVLDCANSSSLSITVIDDGEVIITKNNIYSRNHFSNELVEEERIEEEEEEVIEFPDKTNDKLLINDSLEYDDGNTGNNNTSNVVNLVNTSTNSNTSASSFLASPPHEKIRRQIRNYRKFYRKNSNSFDLGFSGRYFPTSKSNSLNSYISLHANFIVVVAGMIIDFLIMHR
ncbi:unnamed protein product [Trichobilharzia szidati]|nr:unnamed protein product [Trichobilharzia szidati]